MRLNRTTKIAACIHALAGMATPLPSMPSPRLSIWTGTMHAPHRWNSCGALPRLRIARRALRLSACMRGACERSANAYIYTSLQYTVCKGCIDINIHARFTCSDPRHAVYAWHLDHGSYGSIKTCDSLSLCTCTNNRRIMRCYSRGNASDYPSTSIMCV